MKIIVSSKHLFSVLSKIDFEKDFVEGVIISEGKFIFNTNSENLEMYVHSDTKNESLPQWNRDWLGVRKLLGNVEEQPLTIKITSDEIFIYFYF